MQRIARSLAQKSGLELFFRAWIATAIGLAIYIATASAMVSDVNTALFVIGAPIAMTKAALILSGLGFLIWFVVLRPSGRD